jgi:hypothetical protein
MVGIGGSPNGNTTSTCSVVVTATAIHAFIAAFWSCRIGLVSISITSKPITAPLRHITSHIVNARTICRLRTYYMAVCAWICIVSAPRVPRYIVYIIASAINKVTKEPIPITILSRNFPFRLRRQTKLLACKLVQGRKKCLNIIPTYIICIIFSNFVP